MRRHEWISGKNRNEPAQTVCGRGQGWIKTMSNAVECVAAAEGDAIDHSPAVYDEWV